jgi:GNAT superfamily N-acetyltransferase
MEHGAWFARLLHPDGSLSRLVSVESPRYPDDSIHDMAEGAVADEVFVGWRSQAIVERGRVTRLDLAPDVTAKAPGLWFVEFREDETALPVAHHLIAFTGHNQPDGTLLDHDSFSLLGIANRSQLGAIRWYPATGEIHQLYVQPAYRRQGIGRALVYAIGALNIASGRPRVWSQGPRTELGEHFRNASPLWTSRTPETAEFLPPMTPGEA